jgi:hypothetical protein
MKHLILLSLLIIASCSSGQKKMPETSKLPAEIALGQTTTIDKTKITFTAVIEDSRCPTNVQCIWAGRAKVLVTITEKGKDAVEKEVILGETKPGENADKTVLVSNGATIMVSELKPYPKDSNNEVKNYILVLDERK